MIVNKEQFFELQSKINNISFEQTLEWLECNALESICKIVYLVDNLDNPQIACWGRETSRRFFGRKLMIDGLSYDTSIKHKVLTEFFKSLSTFGYTTIEISDIEQYSPNFEIGIRRAGYIRPWGMSLCPMSIIVELDKEFSFHRNWRRNVKKSREAGNLFVYVEKPTLRDAEECIKLFAALNERKGINHIFTPSRLLSLLSSKYDLFFVTDKDGKFLSFRIEYKCNALIYDTYAATSREGIKTGAAYQIQEDIFRFYREKGFKRFDYGRISPSNDNMDDIFVAKNYSGGTPIGYNGQWIYTTNKYRSFLVNFYMYILHNNKCF